MTEPLAATQAENVESRIKAIEKLGQHGRMPDYWRTPLALAFATDEVAARKLLAALEVYADPKHWAIRRNGKTFEDCIWIGPGATDTVSDGPKTAREALA